ncbi:Syntaxin-4 [Aphelenchoides besseyi]|nr:Syntaxin-4 [Aphelenchoides besseyi]KAI6210589.1 Syntaxin-4 [Aphelenchoides besseyi]
MVRDRLRELEQRSRQEYPNQHANGTSVVVVDPDRLPYDTRMLPELNQMNELRQSISRLEDRIRTLNLKQSQLLSAPQIGPQSQEELEFMIDEIKDHIRSLYPRISSIKASIIRDRQLGHQSETKIAIRQNQYDLIKRRFEDVYELFNSNQVDYKRRLSRRVKRQLQPLTTEHLTDQDVDEMLESKAEDIFYRRINPLMASGQAVLKEVTHRHNEILSLGRSIKELHDLYLEVQMMISLQGETVNDIENNVQLATDAVHEGNQNVIVAKNYKKQAQRKTCILVIVGVAVLFACLIIVLLLTLGK